MNRAFEKSLWWWGGLVLRCILLASPIRSRWLKYFSNSFCSQQIWFCALKGFTRKNLKFNCSNLSWLDIVKNMNKFQCHGNLFVGRQMKKQFANRNRSLNSFIYLWTLIHDSSFRAINVLFCFGESRSWQPARKSWKYEVLGQVPYFSLTANIWL